MSLSLFGFDRPVAHSGLGERQLRLGRLRFQLGAQLAHVQAKVMGVLYELGAPHIGQQLAVRDHLPALRTSRASS